MYMVALVSLEDSNTSSLIKKGSQPTPYIPLSSNSEQLPFKADSSSFSFSPTVFRSASSHLVHTITFKVSIIR